MNKPTVEIDSYKADIEMAAEEVCVLAGDHQCESTLELYKMCQYVGKAYERYDGEEFADEVYFEAEQRIAD